MSATLVVTGMPNPSEMDAAQSYLNGVMPLLMEAGGTMVKRLKVVQVVKGRPSGMVLVMDFPSEQTSKTCLLRMHTKRWSRHGIKASRK
ncbi:MAG: hypothetical protein AAGA70_17320 [Pseudomonadota bacterium]